MSFNLYNPDHISVRMQNSHGEEIAFYIQHLRNKFKLTGEIRSSEPLSTFINDLADNECTLPVQVEIIIRENLKFHVNARRVIFEFFWCQKGFYVKKLHNMKIRPNSTIINDFYHWEEQMIISK